MKSKLIAGRKKATILVSKQTVADAVQLGESLISDWQANDPDNASLSQLQSIVEHLASFVNKGHGELMQDGVSSVEDYFDDIKQPATAEQVKREVDMIAKWRRQAKGQELPIAASGSDNWTTDRDEKGEPKAPEQVEVPRVAAAAAPAAVPAPVAPAQEGKADITQLSSEALAKAIKALTGIKEFETDKAAQAFIELMAQELKNRPVEVEEPKAAAPAAPAVPAPVAASAKKKKAIGINDVGQGNDVCPYCNKAFAVGEFTQEGPGGKDFHQRCIDPMKERLKAQGHTPQDQGLISQPQHSPRPTPASPTDSGPKMLGEFELTSAKAASGNASGAWSSDQDKGDVVEDGGRTPEVAEAHSMRDDNTGISRPATTAPIKLAAEMTSSKALKQAEKLGNDLKKMYLEAKSITGANDQRAVREAVEAIFKAGNLFDEAVKVLNKQVTMEEAEEAAIKLKDENKGKKSSFGGLTVAAAE